MGEPDFRTDGQNDAICAQHDRIGTSVDKIDLNGIFSTAGPDLLRRFSEFNPQRPRLRRRLPVPSVLSQHTPPSTPVCSGS